MGVCYVAWIITPEKLTSFTHAKNQSKWCANETKTLGHDDLLMFGTSTDYWPFECALRVMRSRGVGGLGENDKEIFDHVQLVMEGQDVLTTVNDAEKIDWTRVSGVEAAAVMALLRDDEGKLGYFGFVSLQTCNAEDEWVNSIKDGEVNIQQVVADFIAALKRAVELEAGFISWAPYY
jgi:hypothetical protein